MKLNFLKAIKQHIIIYVLIAFFSMVLNESFCQNTSGENKFNKIKTSPGPEDIALDSSTAVPRLLISCAQRRKHKDFYGSIEMLEFGKNVSETIKLDLKGLSIFVYPHGISIAKVKNNYYLYVINHPDPNIKSKSKDEKNRHVILKFRIENNLLTLDTVYYNKSYLLSPNDIFANSDGSFYVTNDNKGMSWWDKLMGYLLKGKRGSIVYFDGKGYWSVVANKLKMPNGIGVSGNNLYTTLARGNKLIKFDIQESDKSIRLKNEKKIISIKGGDNITFQDNKYLLTTSHYKPLKFFLHSLSPKHESPSKVIRLKLDNEGAMNQPELLYPNADINHLINAGSTALIFNNKLYISQIFEAYILEINLNK